MRVHLECATLHFPPLLAASDGLAGLEVRQLCLEVLVEVEVL